MAHDGALMMPDGADSRTDGAGAVDKGVIPGEPGAKDACANDGVNENADGSTRTTWLVSRLRSRAFSKTAIGNLWLSPFGECFFGNVTSDFCSFELA